MRVQLIRRHGRSATGGVRVLAARRGEPTWSVESVVLGDVEELLELPLERLATGHGLGLPAYDGPLWLVCTNGRRDLCCSERGRPVAAALAARWPDATWETTHLGGHRFAATLLALPSGVALGRLDPVAAAAAVEELVAGRLPLAHTRGRAGLSPAAQVAELRLRADLGEPGLAGVRTVGVAGSDVLLDATGGRWRVPVTPVDEAPRRQSCGDAVGKPTTRWQAGASSPA
ncbi:MAG: sucrase ferredoxin [Nocardioides sp.]